MAAIINVSGGPVPAGSTPLYQARFLQSDGTPITLSMLTTVTLTICDTATGVIINGCQQVPILNTGRGTIDPEGNLTITLEAGDTSMSEALILPQIQRSLIIDWTYNSGTLVGRHQANFTITALAGP